MNLSLLLTLSKLSHTEAMIPEQGGSDTLKWGSGAGWEFFILQAPSSPATSQKRPNWIQNN